MSKCIFSSGLKMKEVKVYFFSSFLQLHVNHHHPHKLCHVNIPKIIIHPKNLKKESHNLSMRVYMYHTADVLRTCILVNFWFICVSRLLLWENRQKDKRMERRQQIFFLNISHITNKYSS